MMPRAMMDKTVRLNERQVKFVRLTLDGVPMNKAAVEAGWADGSRKVERILAQRGVANTIIQGLQGELVRWRELSEAAKRALYLNLTDSDSPRGVRNVAAKIVFDTLKRTDAATLSDVIEAEDKASNIEEMAIAILGKHGTVAPPPEGEQ